MHYSLVWTVLLAFLDWRWFRCNHSPGDFCLNPFLFFFFSFFLSFPFHPHGKWDLGSHLLIPSCHLLSFILVVMVITLFGLKHWDKINTHSCATEVFAFSLMIYREFYSRHARGRITVQLNCWGDQPKTTQLHFPASWASLQFLWRFWVDVGFWLDVCRFWCFFSKGKLKETKCECLNWVSHRFCTFIQICWSEILK